MFVGVIAASVEEVGSAVTVPQLRVLMMARRPLPAHPEQRRRRSGGPQLDTGATPRSDDSCTPSPAAQQCISTGAQVTAATTAALTPDLLDHP